MFKDPKINQQNGTRDLDAIYSSKNARDLRWYTDQCKSTGSPLKWLRWALPPKPSAGRVWKPGHPGVCLPKVSTAALPSPSGRTARGLQPCPARAPCFPLPSPSRPTPSLPLQQDGLWSCPLSPRLVPAPWAGGKLHTSATRRGCAEGPAQKSRGARGRPARVAGGASPARRAAARGAREGGSRRCPSLWSRGAGSAARQPLQVGWGPQPSGLPGGLASPPHGRGSGKGGRAMAAVRRQRPGEVPPPRRRLRPLALVLLGAACRGQPRVFREWFPEERRVLFGRNWPPSHKLDRFLIINGGHKLWVTPVHV